MTILSRRAGSVLPAGTVTFLAAAARRRSRGEDVISLAAGEPYFPTAEPVNRAAIEVIERQETRYAGSEGTPLLKQALAEKLQAENGLAFDPDEIVVSNGTKPLITAAILALADPGDEVVIPTPYFVSYPEIARIAGAVPVFVHCEPESGYRLTAEVLRSAITDRTRVLLLSNPNNPAGAVHGADDWRAIAAVLDEHPRIHLVVDEIFEHIVFDRKPVSPAAGVPALRERTVVINGFSKGYGMNGWRIGFAAGPRAVIRAIATIAAHFFGAPSAIAQAGAIAALRENGKASPGHLAELRIARDRGVEKLNAIEGLACHSPEATFLLFPSFHGLIGRRTPDGTPIDSGEAFAAALLAATGVTVVPGEGFGRAGHVRLSVAQGWAVVGEALERLDGFAASLR